MELPDGSFFLAIGGSGGSRIFGSIFQTLINLDLGLDISNAVEYGRLHHQLYPVFLEADNIYPPQLLDALRERGHNITGISNHALDLLSGNPALSQCLISTELPLLFKPLCTRTVGYSVSERDVTFQLLSLFASCE